MIDQIRTADPRYRSMIAILMLGIACVIGSLEYASEFAWFFSRTSRFVPDLASGIIALLLLLPVIRGDFLYSHKLDLASLITLLLIFYLLSVFAQIGLGGHRAWMQGPTFIFALAAIALANFRPQRYGELAVIAVVLFGGLNLASASKMMGFSGYVFLVASTVGTIAAIDFKKVITQVRGH